MKKALLTLLGLSLSAAAMDPNQANNLFPPRLASTVTQPRIITFDDLQAEEMEIIFTANGQIEGVKTRDGKLLHSAPPTKCKNPNCEFCVIKRRLQQQPFQRETK
jgi:hypothetical protein